MDEDNNKDANVNLIRTGRNDSEACDIFRTLPLSIEDSKQIIVIKILLVKKITMGNLLECRFCLKKCCIMVYGVSSTALSVEQHMWRSRQEPVTSRNCTYILLTADMH